VKKEKLRILFAPLSIFISHVTRCLCVAEVLHKRGHIIEFVSCQKYKMFIEDAGFNVHQVSEIEYEKGLVFGAPHEYKRRFNTDVFKMSFGFKKMIAEDTKIIENFKPDVIVYDGRITHLLSAYEKQIPCFEIRNHLGILSKEEMSFLKIEIPFNTEDINNDERDFALEFIKAAQSQFFNKKWDQNLFHLAPVIIPGIPEFEIQNENCFQLRKNIFVGPFFWKGWKKDGIGITDKIDGKIIVVVATGSTFPFKTAINSICNALSDDRFQVVINAGDNYNIFTEDIKRKNCHFYKYIPLGMYLEKADLVIHHGGHGTTMHVLKAGLPSIIIPFNGDHMVISHQIENLKLGLVLKKYPDDISAADVLVAVNEIMNNGKYKENAKYFQQLLENANCAEEKAADFIELSYSQK